MNILSYLILSIAVIYSFVLPSYGEISFLMEENKKYDNSIESIRQIENRTTELLTQVKNIDPEVKNKVETVLPNSLDFVRLVSQIDNVASNYALRINDISVVEKNANPDSSGEFSGGFEVLNYNSAVISFTFVSNYNNFINFTNELEKSLRILDIRNLQIDPASGNTYEFRVSYETYWLPSLN
jgi:Tfp pilus assembly protein PilO